MPKKKKKIISILFLGLMLITSVLFMAACSKSEETNKEAINKVLEHEFNGPDEKLMDLMWNPKYRTVDNDIEENKELDQYLEKIYGPYFTDSGLHSFIAAFGGTQYQTFAHNAGYALSFKGVTYEQMENDPDKYTFVAKVGYKKSGEEEKTANVEGEVRFSTKEEEKIGTFKYGNDGGLSDLLRK